MRIILSFFLVIYSWTNVNAQIGFEKFKHSADSLIKLRLPDVSPGGVVLIGKDSKVLYKKAFGLSNVSTKVAMKTDQIFRIGSIGKQFTAVAILQLIEEGKLEFNDSVQKFLPDFPSRGAVITIGQLLSQTSGIRNYFELETGASQEDLNNYKPKQVIDIFKKEPLKFAPGTAFEYSNSNYFLLGYIIEKVTGLSYKDYLMEYVVKKAGLTSTFYIDPNRTDWRRATPYSRLDDKLELAELQRVNLTYGAGALESTADDLWKWHQALYEGKLISPASLKRATTAFKLADGSNSEYGLGWFIKSLSGEPTIEHSGSTDGYQTDEIYLPHQNIYIVTLFNCYETDMDWIVLTNDLAKLAIGKNTGDYVSLSPEKLKKYTGTYEVVVGTVSHQMRITLEASNLFVEALNPNDRLPKVQLYSETEFKFYIKEAALKFEFIKDKESCDYKLVTYNSKGKDAEWTKEKSATKKQLSHF